MKSGIQHQITKAFTLIELLIVVLIIAILAAIAVPNFLEFQTRAKVSRVKSDMRTLATAIEAYAVDNDEYPIVRRVVLDTMVWGDDNHYTRFNSLIYAYTRNNSGRPLFQAAFALTTPVSYITSFPTDPFLEFDPEALGLTSPLEAPASFWYKNISGAYDAVRDDLASFQGTGGTRSVMTPAGFSSNIEPIRFNNTGKIYQTSWLLFSVGPTRTADQEAADGSGNIVRITKAMARNDQWDDFRNGITSIYDPSNGTISQGYIFRLSGGIPE